MTGILNSEVSLKNQENDDASVSTPTEQHEKSTTLNGGLDTMQKSFGSTPLNVPVDRRLIDAVDKTRESIQPSDQVVSNTDTGNPPFSVYEEAKNHRYTIDYFGIPDVFKMLDNPLDPYDLKNSILYMEDWVHEEIAKRKMPDTTQSYDMLIDEILSSIGKEISEKTPKTIYRIVNYLLYIRKVEEAERLKPRFITDDTP